MIVKPNWDIFKAKFSENPQNNFEWMCYLLFCAEYKIPYGISRYKNQIGIETQTIEHNSKIIGFQSKFYDSTLSNHKRDLIELLHKVNETYPNLTILYIYSNQEWGQGRNGGKSEAELEVEKIANEFNIDIKWKLTSFFESNFVCIENKVISSYFFSPLNLENVFEKIEVLNNRYDKEFSPLKDGLIHRGEETKCIDLINQGSNFIIHGKAGRGKSGVTANLISHLKCEKIPYLAIKLDKNVPEHNIDKWSENLGLTCNVAEALDFVSKNTQGVLILDQLDALRWTQGNSKIALDICYDLINKIELLNTYRDRKISIVFVCRTYDLLNDNSIRRLFENNNSHVDLNWDKIYIDDITEEDAKKIIGKEYDSLNVKTKNVLRILSNIFIWQQVRENTSIEKLNECASTAKLIQRWWDIVKSSCDIEERKLEENKKNIVEAFENSSRLEISKRRLIQFNSKIDDSVIDFLVSQNFLVSNNEKISFAHQSILDYLVAQNMEKDFVDGLHPEEIIGDKQTLTKRFQLQLLMQLLLEEDSKEFILFGQKLVKSERIRYSFKFVFYEILSQIDNVDENIEKFILENCMESVLLNESILNNIALIRLLMDNKILDEWVLKGKNIDLIVVMLYKLSAEYTNKEINFIKTHKEILLKASNRFDLVFSRDVANDSDELFELRIESYSQDIEKLTRLDFDIIQVFKKNQKRAVILLKLIMTTSLYETHRRFITDRRFLNSIGNDKIENYEFILEKLLPLVPTSNDNLKYNSRWSNCHSSNHGPERVVIELIKLASKELVIRDPELFFKMFEMYFGKGYYLYNEIILFAINYLDIKYSDKIIEYLVADLDNNIMDYTSNNENMLSMVKNIIQKYSKYCNDKIFSEIEKNIYYYVPGDILKKAKRRYDFRRKECKFVVWNYHGALQCELLEILDESRLSEKSKSYIKVLKRKFLYQSDYNKPRVGSLKSVTSPINNKKFSNKEWLQILTNNKIKENRNTAWKETGEYYIESTLLEFGSEFQNAVSKDPNRFLAFFFNGIDRIREEYSVYLLNGIAYSEKIYEVDVEKLEKLLLIFIDRHDKELYLSILNIIYKLYKIDWDVKVINFVIGIVNEDTDKFEKYEYEKANGEFIQYNRNIAINHTKCVAINTLSNILKGNNEHFEKIQILIEKNINDDYLPIKFAIFNLLRIIYSFNRGYASSYILKLFNEDILVTGAYLADHLIYYISESNDLNSVVLEMYSSKYEFIQETGIKLMVNLYFRDGLFQDIIENPENISKPNKKKIIQATIDLFDNPQYNKLCKEVLLLYKDREFDLELSRLFYNNLIDLDRDIEFICAINDAGSHMIRALHNHLIEKALSIVAYRDIVLSFCKEYIEDSVNSYFYENELSSLLFRLYDETKSICEFSDISIKCLDLIDLMFEKNIGNARELSKSMMDR